MRPILVLAFLFSGIACTPRPQGLPSTHPAVVLLEQITDGQTDLTVIAQERIALELSFNTPSPKVLTWYTSQLSAWRTDLQQSSYQVYTWEAALWHFPEQIPYQLLNNSTGESVFVILTHKKKLRYLKMKGGAFYSCLPWLKGSVLAGWL